MVAVLLGLFAALCWSLHDMLARLFAARLGAYRLAFLVLVCGAALLVVPVLWRGVIWRADSGSLVFALAMAAAYALALGGLFKAFSLAPVSIVGPLTSAYPALVVAWGVVNGLQPTPLHWLAVALILAGVYIVPAFGPSDGGVKAVAPGKLPQVFLACAAASLGFASSIVLGQRASLGLGEFETTLVSRLPAALLIAPLAGPIAWRNGPAAAAISSRGWLAIGAMALLDVLAVSGINYAGQFPNREFGSMAISTYGALSVVLARLFLREAVSAGQWAGIGLLTAGVAYLGYASP